MQHLHANAKLVPSMRLLLVQRVLEEHWKISDVSAALGVSERTAYRRLARWRAGVREALHQVNRNIRPDTCSLGLVIRSLPSYHRGVPKEYTSKLLRVARISQAFTPASPVDDPMLFADRPDQVMTCIDALFQKGLHVAVYGERGVGKSSLARVLPRIVAKTELPSLGAVRVDCNTQDDFRSIWRKIFRELDMLGEADEWPDLVDPEDVRYSLQQLLPRTLIVIDELDRLEDDNALTLLADTLKTLADHAVNVTVMLVGVSGSIEDLIGEHASIVRSIVQVQMPRMSEAELRSVLTKGAERSQIRFDPAAEWRIVRLAEGLPHLVHLLALHSGHSAAQDDRDLVVLADVDRAVKKVVETHTMASEYSRATRSPQPGHLFEEVLLACAFAPRNDLGYFRAGDVREPLSAILQREMKIPNFQRHLKELSSATRGLVLQMDGPARHHVYRFSEPLLEPFVKMRAVSTGLVSDELREQLQKDQDEKDDPRLFDRLPSEPEPPV